MAPFFDTVGCLAPVAPSPVAVARSDTEGHDRGDTIPVGPVGDQGGNE